MTIFGTVCEIGTLEGEGGERGVVLRRQDDTFVTIKGLTEDETRALAPLFLDGVELTIAAKAEQA